MIEQAPRVSTEPVRPDSVKWVRRAALVALAAWIASYALLWWQFRMRVMHPHFLPLVSLMLVQCCAVLVALAAGVWRVVHGPKRTVALGWLLAAMIPVQLWVAHVAYAFWTVSGPVRPINLWMKIASVAAASLVDGEARVRYPNRLEGERVVMIYGTAEDPDADVAAVDEHLKRLEQILGKPLAHKVHWVRGRALGLECLSFWGIALGTSPHESPAGRDRLDGTDRHETAHNVLNDQVPLDAHFPNALLEGWAELQERHKTEMAERVWVNRPTGSTLSVPELLSADWYCRGDRVVYCQGALLVECILRRYGGAKLFELCSVCRPETIADDVREVLGVDLNALDELYWSEIRELAAGMELPDRAARLKELGLPNPGPDDASARREFLSHYPEAAKRLKEAYRKVRITATIIYEEAAKSASEKRNSFTLRFEHDRNAQRTHLLLQPGRGTAMLYVVDPPREFAFFGDRAADGKLNFRPTRDTIEGVATPQDEFGICEMPAREITPASAVAAPYSIWNLDIAEWLTLLTFSVSRVERLREDTRSLVRVHFDVSRRNGKGEGVLQAGWVDFSPDDGWTIRRYEMRTNTGEGGAVRTMYGRVQYGPKDRRGISSLKSLIEGMREGKRSRSFITEFERFEFGSPPESVFDPATYGGVVHRERPLGLLTRGALWSALGSAVSAVVLLGIAAMRRKRYAAS